MALRMLATKWRSGRQRDTTIAGLMTWELAWLAIWLRPIWILAGELAAGGLNIWLAAVELFLIRVRSCVNEKNE